MEIRLIDVQNCTAENPPQTPCIIVGPSPEELRPWKERGFCVLVELKALQTFKGSEQELAERITAQTRRGFEGFDNVCIHADLLSEREKLLMWQHHMGEPGTIGESERVFVRESVPDDAFVIREIYRDARCGRYLEPLALPQIPGVEDNAEEVYAEYLRLYRKYQYPFYGFGIWTVVEKGSGQAIGWAGITAESHEGADGLYLGYALLPAYWGQGLALEACRLILEFVQEQELTNRVYIRVRRDNLRSLKLAQALRQESKTLKILIQTADE
ncbi:MAG: GNAT family N-acetyltransferase [Lachnospiraceae bacterium]|nr:GNAT family N-acetyltransferase [Lachnospiraceae bacterium]